MTLLEDEYPLLSLDEYPSPHPTINTEATAEATKRNFFIIQPFKNFQKYRKRM